MKHRLILLTTFALLSGFASASSLDQTVQFVRRVVTQLKVAEDIQRWDVSEPSTPLPEFPSFHEFRVGNWRFAADPIANYVSGNEVTLGGSRPGKPTGSREPGLSEAEVLANVKEQLGGLGWQEGSDYQLSNSIDASHPRLGIMAEAQAGLQVVELKRPDRNGFTVHDPAGNFHVQIATGRVVSFSIVFRREGEQFEDVTKLYDLRTAATKAHVAAKQLINSRLPAFTGELPTVDELVANVQREYGSKVMNSDPGLTVEPYPSALLNEGIRPANYFFRVGPAGITVHATSGRVVSGMIAAHSGGIQSPLPSALSRSETDSMPDPRTKRVQPETNSAAALVIPSVTASILVGVILGGIFWKKVK